MKKLVLTTAALLAVSVASAPAVDAQAIWKKDCAKCHGANGDGKTKMGQKLKVKDYTDAEVQAKMTDAGIIKAVKDGFKENGKTRMKAYGETLSDEEIKALVQVIRGLKK